MNNYKLKVKMSCYNCVNNIIRILSEHKIKNVNISLENQLVEITSDKPITEVIQIISKTGKIPSIYV